MMPHAKTVWFGLFVILVLWSNGFINCTIVLRPLSQQYLPYDYEKDGNKLNSLYGVNEHAVEASAFDVNTGLVYAAGEKYIHIVNYTSAMDPKITYKKMIDAEVNDVELCGSKVAFLIEGNPGSVDIYDLYNADTHVFNLSITVEVGFGPSTMKFADDCNQVVVANEGQPYESADGSFVDPEGSIAIVRLEDPPTVNTLDFTKFNDIADEFLADGVRWPYREDTTFSQSLEPQSVTINSEVKTVAYVSLQENNAIAVVDIFSDYIEHIYALGTKSWKQWYMDASDKDRGIHFKRYDIYSFYQPDGIQFFEVAGVGYIATANEGKHTQFMKDGQEWTDVQRGRDFIKNDQLSEEVSEELKAALKDDKRLGRLEFSKVDGQNPNYTTKFDKLNFFGGRGISVRLASDMSLIWDSENIAEFFHVLLYQDVFNANLDFDNPNKQKPSDLQDQQSDNKGPECESIEVGEYNGTRVLFTGIEGSSSIMVFSFAEGSVEPKFESISRHGATDKTFSQLLEDRNLGDLNPEDLKFIPAEHSSTGNPLLLVTGTASGTLAMYEITDSFWETPTLPPHVTGASSSTTSSVHFLFVCIILAVHRIMLSNYP